MGDDKNSNLLAMSVESLPKMLDFPEMEREVLEFWGKNDIFQKYKQRNSSSKKKFRFIDGPITANNPMGIHHTLGRTLKDAFQRYHSMLGEQQRFQNGHDCQGLWLEVEVEKALGLNSKKDILAYSLEKFSKACRSRVDKYSVMQQEQSKRLGMFMDWPDSYLTMDDSNIEHIWYFLSVVNERGWLYKGNRVMPWCPRCSTSLSAHEMADSYEMLTHDSVYFRLPVKGEPNRYFLVWTTTPWTLAANVALAVHPEMEYAAVRQGEVVYYLAKSLLSVIDGGYELLKTVTGDELVGLEYEGPFDEILLQQGVRHGVIPWREVSAMEGTGIVHIAPGCGAEDHELGQEYGLPALAPITEDGTMMENCGQELVGLQANDAGRAVFSSLERKDYLYKVVPYEHSYPTCWRCKEELLYKLVSEWFIATDGVRHELLEAARTVKWVPESAGKRMEDWLANMGDWCISRKRFWGLPLPFYECECGELTVVKTVDHLRELAVKPEVVDQLPELHRPWIDEVVVECPACNRQVNRVPEVGDCWLDAGIVPFSTLNYLEDRDYWKEWYPADLVFEMVEQVRLWFYSMLFMSVTLEGQAPYRTVATHGKVSDENGEPFHKTSPNFLLFDDAAEKVGVDPMRWFFCSKDVSKDVNFSDNLVHETKRKLGPFWNALLFFLTNAEADGLEPGQHLTAEVTDPVDLWLLARLNQLVQQARHHLDEVDARSFTRVVETFLDDLTNWWIRLNRQRFWKHELDKNKLSAYRVLYTCLKTSATLVTPLMPFLAEFFHQRMTRAYEPDVPLSVHLLEYPVPGPVDSELLEEFSEVKKVVTLGLKSRAENNLRVRQPLSAVTVASVNLPVQRLKKFQKHIKRALNVKAVKFADDPSSLSRHVLKPNFKVLGPRFGKAVVGLADTLERLDQDTVGSVAAGNDLVVNFRGTDGFVQRVRLYPSELTVTTRQEEGLHTTTGEGTSVALNTVLSEELLEEGLARDFVRSVQNARKNANLAITDEIVLLVKGTEKAVQPVEKYREYIQRETLSRQLLTESAEVDETSGWYSGQLKLNGQKVKFGLKKAKT
ncbi:MAG: isoleucine--tRNA ligase [Candidatus Odinarchaeota archaeon]